MTAAEPAAAASRFESGEPSVAPMRTAQRVDVPERNLEESADEGISGLDDSAEDAETAPEDDEPAQETVSGEPDKTGPESVGSEREGSSADAGESADAA
jgi:hypothetical protein